MPLPTPPSATVAAPATTTAPVAATSTPAVVYGEKKVAIKQFGKSKDAAGNAIPAPTPMGVDLVKMSTDLFGFIKAQLDAAKIDAQAFVDACSLDKPSVPGNKQGKVAYATAASVISIFKSNNLLTKERGTSGGAVLKARMEEKDSKIKALEAKLAALEAQLGKTA